VAYKLTFAQLKAEYEHAISGTPDSRISSARGVNDALEYLWTLHRWSWRKKITTLDLVADQEYVDLPADFGELVNLYGADSLAGTGFQKADLDRVALARTFPTLPAASSFLYAIAAASQATAADVPVQRLELGPTPSESLSDAVVLVYNSLPPELSGDTDVPAVPYGFYSVLRRLVRAIAVSDTVQQAGHDWELFSRQIRDYIAADTFSNTTSGGVIGCLGSQVDDYGPAGAEMTLAPHTSILMVED